MEKIKQTIAFGPVPSRRLGRSLGINNIPPKICTYSCVYCQLGKTIKKQIKQQQFYTPEKIVNAVKNKVKKAEEKGESIDYLTFVSDGEPTLDSNLGKEIFYLRQLGIRIAVITNASLLWKKDVKDQLNNADWVSLKIDTVDHAIWKKINKPCKSLIFEKILDGISDFSLSFKGDLTTETMFVKNLNDKIKNIEDTADFIKGLNPTKSYLSVPTRPPSETWVEPTSETMLNSAYQIFTKHGIDAEYLIGYEGNTFGFTGDIEEDILSIASVHPIRKDGVVELLKKAKTDWSIVKKLLHEDKLIEVEYNKKKFYIKRLKSIKI